MRYRNKYVGMVMLGGALISNALPAMGKGQFEAVLKEIEGNNPALALYAKRTEARKIGNHTELSPENPEVEFGLLPSTLGEGLRKDVAVTQSFDFPTIYGKRSKLAGAKDQRDDAQLGAERMEILSEAEECCIRIVYGNALVDLYNRQIEYMKGLEKALEKRLKAGDTTAIEYNKAKLRVVTLESERDAISLERENEKERLAVMNGGKGVEITDKTYGSVSIPADYTAWLKEAESRNPAMAALRSEIEVARKGIALNKAEGLPKLSVGYVGEFTPVEGYQGVKVGVSIPLWANRNRVKQARAELAVAEQEAEDARLHYGSRMRYLIGKANGLQRNLRNYREALEGSRGEELLAKAFEGGEISVGDYYQEMEYYNEVRMRELETARDLQLTLSELNAYLL